MMRDKEILIVRLLFVPLTGMFAFALFTQLGNSLNDIVYVLTEDSDYHIFLRFDTREKMILFLSASWIFLHFVLEFIAYLSKNFRLRFRRLLANFRYAPIVIVLFSGFIISIYDAGMIAYSKHQIRNYIFNDSQSIEKPDFLLFNNYRHWCGNGASAQANYLYFQTAAEGMNNENPFVRSRSLLMSAKVQNWINGGDERFDQFLAQSCRDSSPIVRDVAEKYLFNRDLNCRKYLLSK